MTEILVKRATQPINWTDVPVQYIGKASAVCRTLRDCEELIKWFGDAEFCPYLPVLVNAAFGWVAIAGLGYASAAELQDDAIHVWMNQAEKKAQGKRIFDFDELRERNGLMRKENVTQALGEAIERRQNQHKANPRTDPFRQPWYPNPTERVLFGVDGTRDAWRTPETKTTRLSETDSELRPAGTVQPDKGND